MANEASIVLKMIDQVTAPLKSIGNGSKSLSKEFEILQRKTEQLSKRYTDFSNQSAELSGKAITLKKEVAAAEKVFKKTGDEADRVKLDNLRKQYMESADAAKAYRIAASDTMKEISRVANEARKLDEKQTRSGLNKLFGDGLGAGLAQSGLIKDLGSSISGYASTYIESAIGQPTASLLSETLSGTFSGAAAGAIAGIPGMIAGGILGTISGGINAANQDYTKKDDAFKDYYKSLYETVNANTTEGLTAGKTLAAARETTKLSFTTLLGSEDAADSFLADVLQTANTTPFLYDDLVGISKTLLSFGTAVEDVIPTLTTVGDAGAAMGLSTADIGTVATYLGRMKSSDKATLEYLNPLNERGFSVFQWIADAKRTSVGTVYDMISKSQLSGGEVSSIILSKFDQLYQGQMERQSQTTEGLESTLQGLMENIQAAGGTGYNQLRNEGRSADIAAYGGELGKALEKVNLVAGENKAYLENLSEQYQREALSAVLLGEKTSVFGMGDTAKLEEMRAAYQEATQEYESGSREAGLKMENLREQAEALATAAYESSSAYQMAQDAELDQIAAIRENTAGLAAVTNALNKSNEFTKGESSTGSFWDTDEIIGDIGFNASAQSHAFGLRYVPYDNYPALLHQGERVQTAEEARRASGGGQITITGNSFSVRSDADIQSIAVCLADEIEARALAHGG